MTTYFLIFYRIEGSPKGGPEQLARLVQTQGGQKFTAATGAQQQQQQYTHVQLPGMFIINRAC